MEDFEIQNNETNTTNDKFDKGYFKTLMSNMQYREAYNYASKYRPTDPDKLRNYNRNLRVIQDKGYDVEAQFANVQNPQEKEAIDVANSYTSLSNLYTLNNEDTQQHNQLAQDIQSSVYNLGGVDAVGISISFYPERRTTKNGNDFWAADNPMTIKKFYELSGLDENTLKDNNIEVIHERDGRTTIKFDKNNEKIFQIINGLPLMQSALVPFALNEVTNEISWASYDTPGSEALNNPLRVGQVPLYPLINFYKKDGTAILPEIDRNETRNERINVDDNAYRDIATIKKLIQNAVKTKDTYFTQISNELRQYPSVVTAFGDDYDQDLEARYKQGLMTFNQYEKLRNNLETERQSIMTAIGDRPIYSITLDDKGNITALVPIEDNKERIAIIEDLHSAMQDTNNKRLKSGFMISNDKIGKLYTLLPKEKENKGELTYIQHPQNDNKTDRTRQIFIPGLFSEQVEEQILNDPKYRAQRRLVNMELYGSEYDLIDGSTVIPLGNKQYKIGNEIVDEPTALNQIYRTMAIQDVHDNLIPNHLNSDGNFIRPDEYGASVIRYMCSERGMISRLYPQCSFITDNQSTTNGNSNSSNNIYMAYQLGDQQYYYSLRDILTSNVDFTKMSSSEKRVLMDIKSIFEEMIAPVKQYTK